MKRNVSFVLTRLLSLSLSASLLASLAACAPAGTAPGGGSDVQSGPQPTEVIFAYDQAYYPYDYTTEAGDRRRL